MKPMILCRAALLVLPATLILLGCQTPEQKTAPGAMPTAQAGDVSPRLTASTYVAHGHLLERQGEFEKAAEQYRKALALTPESVTAHNRLGITLNKIGQHHEASDEFRKGLVGSPGSAYLHNNLGFSLYLEGEFELAEKTLQHAIELAPGFPRAHMNRALALVRLGRDKEAFDEFAIVGDEADAHFNMAAVQVQTGRLADAALSLDSALRARPSFEAARQQLREVSRMLAEQEAETAAQAEIDAAAAETAGAPSIAVATPDASSVPEMTVEAPSGSDEPEPTVPADTTPTPHQPVEPAPDRLESDLAPPEDIDGAFRMPMDGEFMPVAHAVLHSERVFAPFPRLAAASATRCAWSSTNLQCLIEALADECRFSEWAWCELEFVLAQHADALETAE